MTFATFLQILFGKQARQSRKFSGFHGTSKGKGVFCRGRIQEPGEFNVCQPKPIQNLFCKASTTGTCLCWREVEQSGYAQPEPGSKLLQISKFGDMKPFSIFRERGARNSVASLTSCNVSTRSCRRSCSFDRVRITGTQNFHLQTNAREGLPIIVSVSGMNSIHVQIRDRQQ